jgi:hypothetical protein
VFCLSYGFMNIQYRHRQTSQALALLNRFSSHVINVYISMKLKVPIGNPFRHIVWITKDICFWTTEMLNIVQNLTHMTRFFLQTSFCHYPTLTSIYTCMCFLMDWIVDGQSEFESWCKLVGNLKCHIFKTMFKRIDLLNPAKV